MKGGNLHPKKIRDKNGKLTTVWVKPDVDYKVYNRTYGSTIDEAAAYLERLGYNKESQGNVGEAFMDAFFKPKEGKTNRQTIELVDNEGKVVNHYHVQIYNRGKAGFELNAYRDKKTDKVTRGGSIKEAVISYEKAILKDTGNKYEACVVIDNKGRSILSKRGNRSSIVLTKEEMEKVKGASVFTHNHPESRCFSLADLCLCMRQGIKQIRAIAPESAEGNVSWVFEPSGELTENWVDVFITQYNKNDRDVRNRFQNKINIGEMSVDECEERHHYEVLKDTVEMLGDISEFKEMKFYYEKRD